MKICVWMTGSLDKEYASQHLMKDIIVELLEVGHDVLVVQRQWGAGTIPKELAKYQKLRVVGVEQEPKRTDGIKRYSRLISYFSKSWKHIKNLQPDVVFVHSNAVSWFPIRLANKKGIPCVYNAQDLFPENAIHAKMIKPNSFRARLFGWLQRKGYNRADAIVTISQDMKHTLMQNYDIPSERISVVYNWGHEVQIKSLQENELRKRHPRSNDEERVVYAGNLGKMQNVELLINCASYINSQNARIMIIGRGGREAALKDLATKTKNNIVSFMPLLPAEFSKDVYEDADVNIIPLLKGVIYTALPSKTADCLASGSPIVFCIDKESEFAKTLIEYSIPVVPPDSPEELAKTIDRVLADGWKGRPEELRKRLFSRDENVRVYRSVIEKTAKNNTI